MYLFIKIKISQKYVSPKLNQWNRVILYFGIFYIMNYPLSVPIPL